MFFNLIFFVVFSLISTLDIFSQDVADSTIDNVLDVDSVKHSILESTNSVTNENRSGNFFDILPVDESMSTNTQTRPSFLDDIENRNATDNNITSVFVRAIAGILFFFGILYMIYKYIRKRSKTTLGSGDIIKVLATTVIAQNKSLSIIEIVDNIYFISTTDKAITMMSEITDKDSKDAIRLAYAKSSENVVEEPFSSMFDKALVMFNVKKKKDDKNPIEVTKEMTEKIRTMDSNVQSYLNSDEEEVDNHTNATISFDKINRYVENDAIGNTNIDSGDDISQDDGVTTTVSKKRVSKKTSKK